MTYFNSFQFISVAFLYSAKRAQSKTGEGTPDPPRCLRRLDPRAYDAQTRRLDSVVSTFLFKETISARWRFYLYVDRRCLRSSQSSTLRRGCTSTSLPMTVKLELAQLNSSNHVSCIWRMFSWFPVRKPVCIKHVRHLANLVRHSRIHSRRIYSCTHCLDCFTHRS